MLRRLLDTLSPWRTVRSTGAWLYQQHAISGARRAIHREGAGYQPCDAAWLNGGEIIR